MVSGCVRLRLEHADGSVNKHSGGDGPQEQSGNKDLPRVRPAPAASVRPGSIVGLFRSYSLETAKRGPFVSLFGWQNSIADARIQQLRPCNIGVATG